MFLVGLLAGLVIGANLGLMVMALFKTNRR